MSLSDETQKIAAFLCDIIEGDECVTIGVYSLLMPQIENFVRKRSLSISMLEFLDGLICALSPTFKTYWRKRIFKHIK